MKKLHRGFKLAIGALSILVLTSVGYMAQLMRIYALVGDADKKSAADKILDETTSTLNILNVIVILLVCVFVIGITRGIIHETRKRK